MASRPREVAVVVGLRQPSITRQQARRQERCSPSAPVRTSSKSAMGKCGKLRLEALPVRINSPSQERHSRWGIQSNRGMISTLSDFRRLRPPQQSITRRRARCLGLYSPYRLRLRCCSFAMGRRGNHVSSAFPGRISSRSRARRLRWETPFK